MTPTDFGLGVLASWLANQLGGKKDNLREDWYTSHEELGNISEENSLPKERQQLFKVYDVFRDLKDMLEYIDEPVAHIVVETSPTTFYNLATLVIEDKTTGIWFAFNRGRMSFQGAGGGAQQTDRAVYIFRERNIPVAPWAVPKHTLDDFEKGFILWPEVKQQTIPLISSVVDQEKWYWIQMRAKEVLYDNNST